MENEELIRIFPRKTKWSPSDALAFFDEPPLFDPPDIPVMVSVTFTWDIARGQRLLVAWRKRWHRMNKPHFAKARKNWPWIGGPAFNHPGGNFVPGRFLTKAVTITSRGCPKNCPWCYVPKREGVLRELPVRDGWVVQDNNLLACSDEHIVKVFSMLRQQQISASFPGGLDLDYLEPWHVDYLKGLEVIHKFSALWVAFDGPRGMAKLDKAKDLLADLSIERKFAYVLIGYEGDSLIEAERRCESVYEAGFLPFAMLWDRNIGSEWKALQRKWARPAIYRSEKSNRGA